LVFVGGERSFAGGGGGLGRDASWVFGENPVGSDRKKKTKKNHAQGERDAGEKKKKRKGLE